MNKDLLIGSFQSLHAPDYLYEVVINTVKCNGNCMMFYTGAPQTTIRVDCEKMNIEKYLQSCQENQIDLSNVIVHAPYIINLASNDRKIQELTREVLNREIRYCQQFKVMKLVVHPGNAVDKMPIQTAINNCAKMLNSLINTNVIICLETMAGKGTEIGKNFQELRAIMNLIKNPNLVGVCLDTCHIWDAGYDLSNLPSLFNDFDQIIGLNRLQVIHVNDSKNPRGSRKDRHENIGYGTIGFDRIINLVYYSRIAHIPKILETPVDDNLIFTYRNEIMNIKNKKFVNWKAK